MAHSMLSLLRAVCEAFHIISREEKESRAKLCRYQNSTASQWVLEELGSEGPCQKHAINMPLESNSDLWLKSPNTLRDLGQR